MKKLRLKPFIIKEIAEKEGPQVDAFEFEMEGEGGSLFTFSFTPHLIPIGLVGGLQGLVLAKTKDQKVYRQILEINRWRSQGLLNIDDKEAGLLKERMKDFSKGFFLKLKEKKFNSKNIDEFIAVGDLFVALDGFPQAFSGLKSLDEKIREMEEAVDLRFEKMEEELRACENERLSFEELMTIAQMKLESDPENKDFKRELYVYEYQKKRLEERIAALEKLRSVSPDAIKQEKREAYDRSFSNEADARRHLIAAEVNTFFENEVPPGIRMEDLWAVSRFHLISPTRGFVQFDQSSVKLHLRRYGEQWKIRAIVRE